MTAFLSPIFGAGAQFFNNQGIVLSGGKINTYLAGTTTPQATWTDSTQAVQNPNPIILDSAGRMPNEMWLQSGTRYKFTLMDANNNLLGYTWDNISGVNDTTANQSEWQTVSATPTFVSTTSFSVPGNFTSTYSVNRRIQSFNTAGTIYGYVLSSSFAGGITSVTIVADSGVLDSGLSAVNVGLLNSVNPSVPQQYEPFSAPVSVASSATTVIGATTSANVTITGSVQISAFDNVSNGLFKLVTFTGSPLMVYNATSLILPGRINIQAAPGDYALFQSLGAGNWACVTYQRASGIPIVAPFVTLLALYQNFGGL